MHNFRSNVSLKLGLFLWQESSFAKGGAGCCTIVSHGNDLRILPLLHSVLGNIDIGLGDTYGTRSLGSEQVKHDTPDLGSSFWSPKFSVCMLAMLLALSPEVSRVDESGVSFWLPGQVSGLAATPQTPGWSMAKVSAFGAVAAAREIQIGWFSPAVNVSLNANLNA